MAGKGFCVCRAVLKSLPKSLFERRGSCFLLCNREALHICSVNMTRGNLGLKNGLVICDQIHAEELGSFKTSRVSKNVKHLLPQQAVHV